MDKSVDINDLVLALSRAQGEFRAVPFNATNPFLKNRYADLGAVIESAKEILSNHQLSVIQTIKNDGANIGVTTMLAHSSGQWISDTVFLPLSDEKGKSLAQVAGTYTTYLRRYSYAAILGLYADEDVDGGEPEKKQDAKKPTQTVSQKPPDKTVEAPNSAGAEPKREAKVSRPAEPTETVALITVWDGKTRKPPQEIMSENASESFKKHFASHELFKVPMHLTNHLKAHFGVAKIADLSYEKATSLAKHLRGEGDDPRWYQEPKKELPAVTSMAENGVEHVNAADVGVDLDTLSVIWKGDTSTFKALSVNEQERINDMLVLVKNGTIGAGDYSEMVRILEMK